MSDQAEIVEFRTILIQDVTSGQPNNHCYVAYENVHPPGVSNLLSYWHGAFI